MKDDEVVREEIARSLDDIHRLLDEGKQFLTTGEVSGDAQQHLWYRGHDRGDYALMPSLFRYQDPDIKERQLFRLYAQNVPTQGGSESVSWETAITMQHYGIPTRLLDWTHKPWMAVFFALMGNPVRPCVHILNALRLNRSGNVDELVLVPENASFCYRDLFFPEAPGAKRERPLAVLPTGRILKNDRLTAQVGCFTAHGTNREPLEMQFPGYLFRIVLAERVWDDARKHLGQTGIDILRLFPDHEGLAQHLRSEVNLRPIRYEAYTGARIRNSLRKKAEQDLHTLEAGLPSEELHSKGIGCCNLDSAYIPRVTATSDMVTWLKEGPPFLFVTGEAGVGKTNFILYCLLRDDTFRSKAHLLFPLRLYGAPEHQAVPHYEGEDKLPLHLYRIILEGSPTEHQRDVARKMIISGDLVLALDGLDELARVKGQDAVETVVRELDSFVGGSSDARVIISCRDHIFSRLKGIGVLSKAGSYKRLKIAPFDEDTVRSVLRVQLQRDPGLLAGIARTPLFYEMIRRAGGHWGDLLRGQKSSTRMEEVWFDVMLREAAVETGTHASDAGQDHVSSTNVLTRIGKIAGKMLKNRSDILDIRAEDHGQVQLITRLSQRPFALFEKQSEAAYGFSHQSLREFVLAWCVAHEVQTRRFDLLEASPSFDYEGAEFYAKVAGLLDVAREVIPDLLRLLAPGGVGGDEWNNRVRNLFEMIGMLMPDNDCVAEEAARAALPLLNPGPGQHPYISYKTRYNIARCLERIHYSAPREPYFLHVQNYHWNPELLDRNQVAAHAIRGFHMETQEPWPLPQTVFVAEPDPKRMGQLEVDVADGLMSAIEGLTAPEIPRDAEFLGINCTLALIRWLPSEPDLQRIAGLLQHPHMSCLMKQNIFYALYRRYGPSIREHFEEARLFAGIAPLSWTGEKSRASVEAKRTLEGLVPGDSVDIWRGHKSVDSTAKESPQP